MARSRASVSDGRSALVANIAARVAALVSLSLATLVVARTTGPAGVGIYALLRVLPGLVGVVISAGLPGAATYFLAGPDRKNRRLPLTIVGMALVGGLLGAVLWAAVAPLLRHVLFSQLSLWLVLVAGGTVLTQLVVATAKSCSQGTDDLPGANRVIVNEELMFLPAYGALWTLGLHGYAASLWGLLIADVATFVLAWMRLAKNGFFRGATRPSAVLARRIAGYGLRAQVGGIVTLLNLRLDFLLVSVFTGPAVLGVYAVASKYAELLRLPALAVTWVAYPRVARDGTDGFAVRARRAVPRLVLLGLAAGAVLALLAFPLLPLVYGTEFRMAVWPAAIIALGLVAEPAAGIGSAFLMGSGRPGLNSMLLTVGLLATVALDFLLIPRHGALGAAWASSTAYLLTDVLVIGAMRKVTRRARVMGQPAPT